MEKSLTAKQHQVKEKFESKLQMEKINTTSFSIFQRNKNFTMAAPSVYKIKDTDSYLIFGDFLAYDFERIKQQLEQMQLAQDQECAKETHDGCCDHTEDAEHKDVEEVTDEPNVSEVEKKEEKDAGAQTETEEAIELLMEQHSITRTKALTVLTECQFDILKATEMLENEGK